MKQATSRAIITSTHQQTKDPLLYMHICTYIDGSMDYKTLSYTVHAHFDLVALVSLAIFLSVS